MKSFITLLDRKKKDRVNTLVQVPFPSTLPHSAAHQDGQAPTHGGRRTSTPSSFLRPQQQHRAPSDNGRTHRPLLSEPLPYNRGPLPAQNGSYYTDSDDSAFVDPFAPSSAKLDLPSKLSDGAPQVYARRGSEPYTANTHAPSSFRFRSQEPTGAPSRGESQPQSGVAAPTSKKGRWLRERRSLSSLLRPQQPNNSAESAPTVPPVPGRVLERKSSFFTRGRSGSTPPAPKIAERTHTARQPSTGMESVQLPTSASRQPTTGEMKPKNEQSHRGSTPLTLTSLNLSGSAVRVGGEGRDSGLPTSPTTRRRAASVPLPLPPPTEPPPPVPDVQRSQDTRKPEVDRPPLASSEPGLMRRPGTSAESRPRPSHNSHGTRSASVSVSAHARPNASTSLNRQEQLASQHHKQSSVSAAEGLVLKSALKHRPVESTQNRSALSIQSVEPLRICKRECTTSKADPLQLPTPSSESSLKGFHHVSVDYANETRAVAQHNKSTSGSSFGHEYPESSSEASIGIQGAPTVERPATSSGATGSFGNLMRGHGLSSSDSRSLPVLDNIWGSFISETAFGSSLPPSPVASISARYRATQSPPASNREQIGCSSTIPKNGVDVSRSSQSEIHWKPGSIPLSSPPVAGLPPVPKPALSLSLTSGPRRRRSRSSANAAVLLTPPTSPTEEVGHQSLDRVISTSVSGNSPPNRSSHRSQTSNQQLGPRLARSASSPSIRPPVSPEIGHYPINPCSADTISRPSVQHQNSQPVPPLAKSESYSQCTPIPGTLVTVPPSAIKLTTSYLGTSSGSPVTPTPHVWVPRAGSGYSESTKRSVIGVSTQASGNGSGGVSEIIVDKYPPVQLNRTLAQGKMIGTKGQEVKEEDPYEEPLLTPPVTPAWVAHVFDPDEEDTLQFSRMRHEATSDGMPLARLGNLAQMRRRKRGETRSSSTQFLSEYSHGPNMTPLDPEKSDTRSNQASKNATLLARNVI